MIRSMKKALSIVISSIIIMIFWVYLSVWSDLKNPPSPDYGHILLMDRHGITLTDISRPGGYQIDYSGSLSTDLIRGILEIEDARFYEHSGVNTRAKIASLYQNIQAGMIVRGGSTITEQYIKNTYYPWAPRTMMQKIREAIGAIIIENNMTKEQILREYLSTVYMGNREYGIQTQIQKWTDPIEIISRLRYPNISDLNRERVIAYQSGIEERLRVAGIWFSSSSFQLPNPNSQLPTSNSYPYITERVERERRSYCKWETNTLNQWTYSIPENICHTQDIELKLTIDRDLMQQALMISKGVLQSLSEKKVGNASILIMSPKDNTILAYIGNTKASEKIDMITRRRSVGSVLKPIIYLLALRSWADAEDYLLDDKIPYETGVEGRYFVPENYNPRSYGPIRIREALGNSLNAATVSLTDTLGLSRVYDFLWSSGVDLDHDIGYYGYGISLGTVETTLENIVDTYGRVLTDFTDPDVWQIAEILRDPRNRARTFGISSILGTSIPLPVKTGTSTDFRDNWAIWYTPEAIVWVWVGNTDGSPMGDISGVSGAWPIWHHITEYMIERDMISKKNIPPPVWIKQIAICLDTPCLRRELSYTRKSESPKSRPIDGIYFESDFFGGVSQETSEKWKMQK